MHNVHETNFHIFSVAMYPVVNFCWFVLNYQYRLRIIILGWNYINISSLYSR